VIQGRCHRIKSRCDGWVTALKFILFGINLLFALLAVAMSLPVKRAAAKKSRASA
jgi:hypothetical protein